MQILRRIKRLQFQSKMSFMFIMANSLEFLNYQAQSRYVSRAASERASKDENEILIASKNESIKLIPLN